MKKLLLIISLTFAVPVAVLETGCTTTPSTQNIEVQTLKAVGQSAEGAVALSAQLYQAKTITADQARQVMDFYNLKFIPVFKLAVATAHSDLSSIASPDVLALASQLSALVISFQAKPTTP